MNFLCRAETSSFFIDFKSQRAEPTEMWVRKVLLSSARMSIGLTALKRDKHHEISCVFGTEDVRRNVQGK